MPKVNSDYLRNLYLAFDKARQYKVSQKITMRLIVNTTWLPDLRLHLFQVVLMCSFLSCL